MKTYEWPNYVQVAKQYEIWAVEWRNNPQNIKLVVIVQSDYMNTKNPVSALVCPLSKMFTPRCFVLRMSTYVYDFGEFTVLIDQVTAINTEALIKNVGELDFEEKRKLRRNLALVMGFMI